jgi:Cu2+-containing amine oxidase
LSIERTISMSGLRKRPWWPAFIAGVCVPLVLGACAGLGERPTDDPTIAALPPSPAPLSDEERQRAVAIAERSAETARLLEAGRSVLADVELVRDKTLEEAGRPDRLALVTHYRYEGDLTIETLVNVTRGRVLEVRTAEHRATPLSAGEVERAKTLAFDDPNVRAALDVPAERILVEPLLTSAGSPDDPLFGHRVVRLLFMVDRDYLAQPIVLVDLTDERVIVEPAQRSP